MRAPVTTRLMGQPVASSVLVWSVIISGGLATGCDGPRTGVRSDGSASSTSSSIGPAGGTVHSADGLVTLEIPAGALASTLTISITPASNAPPGTIGLAYDLVPDGTTFAVPATLTIRYDPALLGQVAPNAVSIATAVGGSWLPQPGALMDPDGYLVAVLTVHLSQWAITPLKDAGSCGCVGATRSAWAACCATYGGLFVNSESTCTCCNSRVGGDITPFANCLSAKDGTVPNFCSPCLASCCSQHGGKTTSGCDCVGNNSSWGPVLACGAGCFAKSQTPEWLACGLALIDAGVPMVSQCPSTSTGDAQPPCQTDSDCTPGFVCSSGTCVAADAGRPVCYSDVDCLVGQVCRNGACGARADAGMGRDGSVDATTTDAASPEAASPAKCLWNWQRDDMSPHVCCNGLTPVDLGPNSYIQCQPTIGQECTNSTVYPYAPCCNSRGGTAGTGTFGAQYPSGLTRQAAACNAHCHPDQLVDGYCSCTTDSDCEVGYVCRDFAYGPFSRLIGCDSAAPMPGETTSPVRLCVIACTPAGMSEGLTDDCLACGYNTSCEVGPCCDGLVPTHVVSGGVTLTMCLGPPGSMCLPTPLVTDFQVCPPGTACTPQTTVAVCQ